MSDIFLSYKREDKAKAQIIAWELEKKGYSVWWDMVIPPGLTWDEVIEKELNASKCVVVLWSKESVNSYWVRTEAHDGNRRRILVPVIIEDVVPPLAFRLIQAAKLIDWNGTLPNQQFDLLMGSVKRTLGQAVPERKIEDKTFINSIDMKFTLIPAGKFNMGSNEYDSEKPVHEVTIGSSFYLGMFQVTQKEWEAVMGNNPSYFKGDNLPVENVSWKDVQEFIKKLNEKEGAEKYRLPSEAEWEYAARAGTTTRYSFGDDDSELGEYAWYAENSGSRPPRKGNFFGYDQKDWIDNKWNGKTHPIREKNPNPWGLYDMHGNVWEWVQDEWHDNYNDAPADGSSWESGNGPFRVFRGGSWYLSARGCRSANRFSDGAVSRGDDLGFRLLRIL